MFDMEEQMKINRTQNAFRNIVFGGLLKVYQILVPFLMRTAMLYILGVEYLGLNSLFVSVIQVLNLAELGIGTAITYSMYKPIAEDDTKRICALLNLYKKYYRIIGAIIGVVGVALVPFIPKIISGEIPQDLNIYILYLLNLAATVASYWLFAYKGSLLSAHQRNDVTSKIALVINSVQYILQIAVLVVLKSYYGYLIINILCQLVANIATSVIVDKNFPEYRPIGNLEKEEVKEINYKVRDLFTSKIGTIIVNSADTIVISSFLGLTVLAIYQNYFWVITSIIGFVTIIFNACTAGIGNSLLVETEEKNYNDLSQFTFIISWIAGFCVCCLLCLYQPFMEIWVGKELLLHFRMVICFCIYYFIYEINQLLNVYKDAAGIWHEDRFRPLITALANLGMNLIMVQFWGLYGILLSTVLSILIIGMPWLLHNLFTLLFSKEYLSKYLKQLLKYITTVFIACSITYWLCGFIKVSGWSLIIFRGILCCIVPNAIFLCVYHKIPAFEKSLMILNRVTKGRIRIIGILVKSISNDLTS